MGLAAEHRPRAVDRRASACLLDWRPVATDRTLGRRTPASTRDPLGARAPGARSWRPLTLLEREAGLAELEAALREAAEGRGRLVLIVGEAGVGKTALVRHAGATRGASRVLVGACEPLGTPEPLGPLFDVAADLG